MRPPFSWENKLCACERVHVCARMCVCMCTGFPVEFFLGVGLEIRVSREYLFLRVGNPRFFTPLYETLCVRACMCAGVFSGVLVECRMTSGSWYALFWSFPVPIWPGILLVVDVMVLELTAVSQPASQPASHRALS